ncbi:MAG: carbamoyltransferase HypF [Actinomycetota bacterium]
MMDTKNKTVRRVILVDGIVQGVGFRPYVFSLASRRGLGGFVLNDAEGVTIEVEGDAAVLDAFERELPQNPPPLARIDGIKTSEVPPKGEAGFRIEPSQPGKVRAALVSPDMSICGDCLGEIRNPSERRFRYAFTNCTNCGPRFTITKDIPYDRGNTTMAEFEMCEECRAEYDDPRDRRFHAQPIACPNCGPQLVLTDLSGTALEGDPLVEAGALLAGGKILAVKGLGGFHLACDAMNDQAVAALRDRKHREEKPFALMASELAVVERFCEVNESEAALVSGHRRPAVLLRRREKAQENLAQSVAPGNRHLAFMLPYTPLHYLLLDEFARGGEQSQPVLVMTSGNVSDEPIAYTNEAAYEDLEKIADYFLVHNRPIHIRCDDSVVRASGRPIRRSRGYAPEPFKFPLTPKKPVLAVGAELKHTFCLAKNDRAFLSHHIGDLENWETMRSFMEGVEHFSRIFEIHPEVIAYDLHPEYLSTKWALGQLAGSELPLPGLDLAGATGVGVQHHHAHIASCLADNGLIGPVIGLALDGTGWGGDGTLWGCEILVADLSSYRRAGHLRAVPLAGGAAAIKEPWRMASVYMREAFGDDAENLRLEFVRRNRGRWGPVLGMAAKGLNSLPTSSAGRLFDAVASAAGLKDRVNYEGQAAIELEQAADPYEAMAYPCEVYPGPDGAQVIVDGVSLFASVCEDLAAGAPVGRVSAGFHNGFSTALTKACEMVRDQIGLGEVALSGGTFQNELLLGSVTQNLEEKGFKVWRHKSVPANDGGISVGQAAIAAAGITQK